MTTTLNVGDRVAWTIPGTPGDSHSYGDGVTIVNGQTYVGTISRLWEAIRQRDENNAWYWTRPGATVDLDVGTARVVDLRKLTPA